MTTAKLHKSARLQRVLRLLAEDCEEHSTLDIMTKANVLAVNSCIADLRANGVQIQCRRTKGMGYYKLGKKT
jgi:hypothetical protein